MFGGRVSPEEVGINHRNVPSFIQRLRDFVQEILTHDVIVQLLGSTDIECEPCHFTVHSALMGLVTVIFGTSGSEFCDEVAF